MTARRPERRKPTLADPTEWLPFIDGYARSGRMDDAIELGDRLLQAAGSALCRVLQRFAEGQTVTAVVTASLVRFRCGDGA